MYYIKRLLGILTTLWAIITLTFFIMKAIPGDPFTDERALPPEVIEAMMDHYGLNDPLPQQYGRYLWQILHGDLGPSFKYPGRSVQAIIALGFPNSAVLGLCAIAISITLGVTLGSLAAYYHRKIQDHGAMIAAVIGISVPSFVVATLLQYFFAILLPLLPVARWGTPAHVVLPSLSLSFLPTAFIARLTRSSLLEVLSQDYIRTAQAKGLSPLRILLVHALPNALLPVISYLGPLAASILTGTFIIERIFGIPGMGQWMINSISNRDYSIIMGMTIFYSALLLVLIFFMDILYSWIDPRIKLKD